METVNERNECVPSRISLPTYSATTTPPVNITVEQQQQQQQQCQQLPPPPPPPSQQQPTPTPLQQPIRQDQQPLGFDRNEGTTTQNRPYNSYQSEKTGFSVLDINALVESALEQAKVEPEVVYAAAHLLLLSNSDMNSGYFVDSSSGILDVASNRPSAMSLSNLLLPDDAGSSSKAT